MAYGYVEDGLILQYDGIDNTSNGHDNSSTIWKDLSGNNNNGIIGGHIKWGENHLIFNGMNTWVNCNKHDNSKFTIDVLCKYDSISTGSENYVVAGNAEAGGFIVDQYQGKNMFNVYAGGQWNANFGNECNKDVIHHFTGVFDGESSKFYEDSVLINNIPITGEYKLPELNTVLSIGSNPRGNSEGFLFFVGKIFAVRFYNRALTSDEINKNHKQDQKRFLGVKFFKYLVADELNYYTVEKNLLKKIPIAKDEKLTAEHFKKYGCEDVLGSLLVPLYNARVFMWSDEETVAKLTATATAFVNNQVLITNNADMSDKTIKGIRNVVCDVSSNSLVSMSWDDGFTWEYFNGTSWIASDTEGMTAETLSAITTSQWSSYLATKTSKKYKFKFILSQSEKLKALKVNYVNYGG